MSGFKKILVPIDGSKNSQRGLDKAIEIANENNGQITGLYVFHLPLAAGIKYTKSMKESAEKKAIDAISPSLRKAEKAGVSFNYRTEGGHAGEKIVKASEKGKFDVIVIGARGLSGAKEKFLGSTSNYVMHKSKIPVMVVK